MRVAHALGGGDRDRQRVDLATELFDLVAGVVEVLGELAGVGRRGVTVGGDDAELRVGPGEELRDLITVIAAHGDGERESVR